MCSNRQYSQRAKRAFSSVIHLTPQTHPNLWEYSLRGEHTRDAPHDRVTHRRARLGRKDEKTPARVPGPRVSLVTQFGSPPSSKEIFEGKKLVYTGSMPFENTFGAVGVGKPLAYLNSLMNLSFALNQGSFSEKFHVYAGSNWTLALQWVK